MTKFFWTLLLIFLIPFTLTAKADNFSFQPDKTIDEVLNDQMGSTTGMNELNLGMEVNLRCIGALATFRNTLNPVSDLKMMNSLNLDIGNIFIMTGINYDKVTNNGQLSRSNWTAASLFDAMGPKIQDSLVPYQSHYEQLFNQANENNIALQRYKSDMDTCKAVGSGYQKALSSLPAE